MLAAPPAETLLQPDPRYPRPLFDLRDPPACLRVAGAIPPLDRAVAIVGTRRASDEALHFVHGLAADLARAGCVIVSGGASGIDRAAHLGALGGGGPTVVVLAGGLGRPSPPQNAGLFRTVAAGRGAVLSEHPDDVPPRSERFVARNRLIAAAARVVVLVEAPIRSGALHTTTWAAQLGRPILAAPGSPWDPRAFGALRLLAGGARVCTSARDVLSVPALGSGTDVPPGSGSDEKSCPDHDLGGDEGTVLRALGTRTLHPDELCRAAGLPAARVQRALLDLTLRGRVAAGEGGRFRAAGRIERGFPKRWPSRS